MCVPPFPKMREQSNDQFVHAKTAALKTKKGDTMLLTVVRCQRHRLWSSIRHTPGLVLLDERNGTKQMKRENVRCEAERSKKQETYR